MHRSKLNSHRPNHLGGVHRIAGPNWCDHSVRHCDTVHGRTVPDRGPKFSSGS